MRQGDGRWQATRMSRASGQSAQSGGVSLPVRAMGGRFGDHPSPPLAAVAASPACRCWSATPRTSSTWPGWPTTGSRLDMVRAGLPGQEWLAAVGRCSTCGPRNAGRSPCDIGRPGAHRQDVPRGFTSRWPRCQGRRPVRAGNDFRWSSLAGAVHPAMAVPLPGRPVRVRQPRTNRVSREAAGDAPPAELATGRTGPGCGSSPTATRAGTGTRRPARPWSCLFDEQSSVASSTRCGWLAWPGPDGLAFSDADDAPVPFRVLGDVVGRIRPPLR